MMVMAMMMRVPVEAPIEEGVKLKRLQEIRPLHLAHRRRAQV